MLMRKIIEKSDKAVKEADENAENGKVLKAFVKAAKAGAIEGFGEGVLITGLIYFTIGTAHLICKVAKVKVK